MSAQPVSDPVTVLTTTAIGPTPALRLRPWRASDAPALVEAHGDPEMRRTLTKHLDDPQAAADWLAGQTEGWTDGTRRGFAVFDADSGTLLGHVVVKRPPSAAAEIGYWTVAAARGRGVAPGAVAAVSRWLFATDSTVDRIELLHAVDNPASCRVAGKAGFGLRAELPPHPPAYPGPGHLHVRDRAE